MSHFISLLHPVYYRPAQIPGHQLISRLAGQRPHLRQETPPHGHSGAPSRAAPPPVQEERQLRQDSSAQGAGTGWEHLYSPVFRNW